MFDQVMESNVNCKAYKSKLNIDRYKEENNKHIPNFKNLDINIKRTLTDNINNNNILFYFNLTNPQSLAQDIVIV